MNSLPAAIVAAKNSLNDGGAWLVLLELQLNDTDSTVLRFVRNTENIEWNSRQWLAFPFELELVTQESDGSINTLQLNVSNVLQAIEEYVNDADGASGSTAIVRVVYSERLDLDAVIEETYMIKKAKCNANWVIFELGPAHIWGLPFPKNIFTRWSCMLQFKSSYCGYSGGTSTCDRSLTDCINLSNEDRYGAYPGIPGTGLDPDTTEAITCDNI